MKMLLAVLVLCVLCLVSVPAQAAGSFDISKLSLSTLVWTPFNTDKGDPIVAVGVAFTPFADALAPKCPTNFLEIMPWAVANLAIVGALDVTGEGRGNLRGIGITETAQVGTVFDAPFSLGVGWHADRDLCWLASLNKPF